MTRADPGESHGRRGSKRRRAILLVAFWLLVPALILELVIAAFDPMGLEYFSEMAKYFKSMERGDAWGYIHRANSEFIAQGVTVRVNSHGLRGPEFETAKAPGRKRILILGDSVVFGWGAEEQDLFPAELQRRFDGDGRGIEVIAAGVGSWNTRAEYEFLREVGVTFQPDVLLLLIVANDVNANHGTRTEVAEELLFARAEDGRSRVGWFFDEAWGALAKYSYLASTVQFLRKMWEAKPTADELRDSARWDDARLALEGVMGLCREQGIELVVFLYGTEEHLAEGSPLTLYRERLAASNVPVHLVSDALFSDPSLRNSVVDSHANAAGHDVLAEDMYELLRRSLP